MTRDKLCKFCDSKFTDNSRFNTQELCSDFCKKEHMNYLRYTSISKDQYLKLLQVSNCQLCNKFFNKRQDLHIDHCHETGKVRGVLCRKCNVAIGSLGDNAQGLQKAIRYLEGA